MIAENLARIRQRMREAAGRVGRNTDEITLVCVVKNRTSREILEVVEAGLTDIGENRLQETREHHAAFGNRAVWHMVGTLQRNKVKHAVKIFDLIHSVDSIELAALIDKDAAKIDKTQRILFEINTSGEASKSGLLPENAAAVVRQAAGLKSISIEGLMTLAPMGGSMEAIRRCFKMLRGLRDAVAAEKLPGVSMRHLSMGMSQDFEIAIEEGATLVRIGTAIFED